MTGLANMGGTGPGETRRGWQGGARVDMAGLGLARHGGRGKASTDNDRTVHARRWQGLARRARQGTAGRGDARIHDARTGRACTGAATPGEARRASQGAG